MKWSGQMFDKKVIGYGCVVSSYHSVRENRFLSEEEISWRRQTKIAEEIKKLRNLFLAEENILIDVIGGSYRYRHHFEECLKTMSRGDSIVIAKSDAAIRQIVWIAVSMFYFRNRCILSHIKRTSVAFGNFSIPFATLFLFVFVLFLNKWFRLSQFYHPEVLIC